MVRPRGHRSAHAEHVRPGQRGVLRPSPGCARRHDHCRHPARARRGPRPVHGGDPLGRPLRAGPDPAAPVLRRGVDRQPLAERAAADRGRHRAGGALRRRGPDRPRRGDRRDPLVRGPTAPDTAAGDPLDHEPSPPWRGARAPPGRRRPERAPRRHRRRLRGVPAGHPARPAPQARLGVAPRGDAPGRRRLPGGGRRQRLRAHRQGRGRPGSPERTGPGGGHGRAARRGPTPRGRRDALLDGRRLPERALRVGRHGGPGSRRRAGPRCLGGRDLRPREAAPGARGGAARARGDDRGGPGSHRRGRGRSRGLRRRGRRRSRAGERGGHAPVPGPPRLPPAVARRAPARRRRRRARRRSGCCRVQRLPPPAARGAPRAPRDRAHPRPGRTRRDRGRDPGAPRRARCPGGGHLPGRPVERRERAGPRHGGGPGGRRHRRPPDDRLPLDRSVGRPRDPPVRLAAPRVREHRWRGLRPHPRGTLRAHQSGGDGSGAPGPRGRAEGRARGAPRRAPRLPCGAAVRDDERPVGRRADLRHPHAPPGIRRHRGPRDRGGRGARERPLRLHQHRLR